MVTESIAQLEARTFTERQRQAQVRVDGILAGMMILQWVASVAASALVAPGTWIGQRGLVEEHFWFSLLAGGALAATAAAVVRLAPGSSGTRLFLGLSQMAFSSLLLHLTAGALQTQSHVFVSIGFLAAYRDSRVLLAACALIGADQLARALWLPGTLPASAGAAPLAAWAQLMGWMAFEAGYFVWAIERALREARVHCEAHARSSHRARLVQDEIAERTRELEEHREKAANAEKMATLGEMAGGIAHEINNPLAIIQGQAEYLKFLARDRDVDASTVLLGSERVIQTVKRITRIVRGLRSFARDGRLDPFAPSPVRQILDDTLAFCEARLAREGIELRVAVDGPEPEIECRAVQVSQAILNLVSNAADAVAGSPDPWVELRIRDAGPEAIEICVTDSGQGIPAAVAERMMQPFFTTKDVGKGTGLGLPIVNGIAQSHGGSLRLDAACENTRFVLRLPRRQEAPALAVVETASDHREARAA